MGEGGREEEQHVREEGAGEGGAGGDDVRETAEGRGRAGETNRMGLVNGR